MSWASLKSRPSDLFYVLWLASHFYIAVFIDMQPLYPTWVTDLFPEFLTGLAESYLASTNDPLVGSLQRGWKGRVNEYTWFWSFAVGLEGFVQIPTTLLGAIGLWKNIQSTWILLLIYGSTTAATVLPCIATIWYAPPPGVILSDPTLAVLTNWQKNLIIGSYAPFFVVPLWMSIDAALRLKRIVDAKEAAAGVKVVKLE